MAVQLVITLMDDGQLGVVGPLELAKTVVLAQGTEPPSKILRPVVVPNGAVRT